MSKKKKKRRYVTYMAHARKKPRLGMRFMAKWSVLALIVIATAVAYVWQRNTIISLGYRIEELGKGISSAGKEESKLRVTLVRLQKPQRLWEEVRERALGLEEVSPNQVMTLLTPRPFGLPPAKRRVSDYPPAAPETAVKVSVPAPHRETSVLRWRR